MKRIMDLIFGLYKMVSQEIQQLKEQKKTADEKSKILRVNRLIGFNIIVMIMQTVLIAFTLTYIFFVFYHWLSLIGVLFTLLFMYVLRYFYQKVYTKMRYEYFEKYQK
ncbi:hypothetical protein [Amphibacillus cookii]|uniref:hypothetical protein n=1 Tax=Amphibacillus cookii TaxID=767787 RepID=UPI0019574FAF|nr:hypothetical protein [Amphibacillus cookii]MBM7543015.1 ABC-type iron transport system FetAB permease component [Amphibacillus cookii]